MWATSMSVDGRHLLRSDSKRLRGWHAAEQRDELAARPHSITSSARASRVAGGPFVT
jgi:hypothetical protein